MPMLVKGVQMVSSRMPKVVSPEFHAVLDWVSVGAFFLGAALLWRRHKRAGLTAMICGTIQAGSAIMTDYPGGLSPIVTYDTHLKMDAGFSGLIASMPGMMGFGDENQAWFFRVKGMEIAATTGLSKRPKFSEERELRAA